MHERIREAYRRAQPVYDRVLTQQSVWARLYIKLFWGGVDDLKLAEQVLAYVPPDFDGRLLDIPVGTAVFTEKAWRARPRASITGIDVSPAMLEQAAQRLADCPHVTLRTGDVTRLPLPDGSVDVVVSMNGLHAFPDKPRALTEINRVLRCGGLFVGSTYVRGASRITDALVRRVLAPKGWFTPPFMTLEELRAQLSARYPKVALHTEGAMAVWACRK